MAHSVHASTGLGQEIFLSKGATPMLIEDLHCMSLSDQMRLASWLKAGLVLLAATVPEDLEISFTPQLATMLSYPSEAIHLPPLRARGNDAVSWAEYFLAKIHPGLKLDPSARQAIEERSWSGNLLELRVALERASAAAEGRMISAQDLGGTDSERNEIIPLNDAVAQFKRRYILQTLERVGGNRTKAARALGVDPRTVFRVLEQEDELSEG